MMVAAVRADAEIVGQLLAGNGRAAAGAGHKGAGLLSGGGGSDRRFLPLAVQGRQLLAALLKRGNHASSSPFGGQSQDSSSSRCSGMKLVV